MKRPPDSDKPPVEGRVFRFPRLWVPPDGIEPLQRSPLESEASNGGASRLEASIGSPSHAERPALEAGEFWGRGDTQQFIAVAAGQAHSATASGARDAIVGAGGKEVSGSSLEPRRTSRNGAGIAVSDATPDAGRAALSASYAWAKVAGAAVLVLGVLVGGGIALAAARGSTRSSNQGAAVTSVQPVRDVRPTPPATTPVPSGSEASSSGGSSSGASPAQAQTAQSAPNQAPQPRVSPSGALICISNCG